METKNYIRILVVSWIIVLGGLYTLSAHALTWVPVTADSVTFSGDYKSEYKMPTGQFKDYVGVHQVDAPNGRESDFTHNYVDSGTELVAQYNNMDLDALYGQTNKSLTASVNAIGVLDQAGKTILVVNGSIDNGYKSEKLQIDPKAKIGVSIIHKVNKKLTLTASLLPQVVFGGDKTEETCLSNRQRIDISCHLLLRDAEFGGETLSTRTYHEEIKEAKSHDLNFGAVYKLMEQTEGDVIDLSLKGSYATSFDKAVSGKSLSLVLAKDFYKDENLEIKGSIIPSTNGDTHSLSTTLDISHTNDDGSEVALGITGSVSGGEASIVPSLALYPEEGMGLSWNPVTGVGLTEKHNGKKYNHSLIPQVILLQTLFGQRTILSAMLDNDEEVVEKLTIVENKLVEFKLKPLNGMDLIHDRESSSIIGFDKDGEVRLNMKVIEQEGLLFLEDLSGAYDLNGMLYKF